MNSSDFIEVGMEEADVFGRFLRGHSIFVHSRRSFFMACAVSKLHEGRLQIRSKLEVPPA